MVAAREAREADPVAPTVMTITQQAMITTRQLTTTTHLDQVVDPMAAPRAAVTGVAPTVVPKAALAR